MPRAVHEEGGTSWRGEPYADGGGMRLDVGLLTVTARRGNLVPGGKVVGVAS